MNEPRQALSKPIEPALTGRPSLREVGERQGDPISSVSTVLREARLKAGYDLSDVANVLRIQLPYLEALEESRFDDLPGTTYAVGFLRSYAGFLGLDADEIVGTYKRERALDMEQQRLAFPAPVKEAPRPRLWLILIVLVLAGLAYGGWQYYASEGRFDTDLVADVSSRLIVAADLGGNEEPAAPPEGESTETPPVTIEPAIETAVESVAAPPEPAETPAAAGQPPGDTVGTAGQEETIAATPLDDVTVESAPALAEVLVEGGAAADPPAVPSEPAGIVARDADPLPEATGGEAASGETDNTVARDDRRPAVARLRSAVPDVATTRPTGVPPPEPVSEHPALGSAQTPASTGPSESVDAVETVALVEPAAADATTGAAREEEPTARADPSATEPAYVPRVFGRGNLDSRVVITARADSWVQIRGADNNELLLTRVLHPGDSYRVPNRPDLVMFTGNAGGLEIRVDDALAPAIGPVGAVRRNIALDPDSLMAGGVGN